MAEINKEKLKKQLIEIYEGYTQDIKNADIKARAQKLFLEYTYMGDIFDKVIIDAIRGLEHIGFDFGRTTQRGVWNLTSEDAEEILKSLKSV